MFKKKKIISIAFTILILLLLTIIVNIIPVIAPAPAADADFNNQGGSAEGCENSYAGENFGHCQYDSPPVSDLQPLWFGVGALCHNKVANTFNLIDVNYDDPKTRLLVPSGSYPESVEQ